MGVSDARSKLPPNPFRDLSAHALQAAIIKAGFAVKINCDEKRMGLCFYRTRTYLLLSINGSRHPAESGIPGLKTTISKIWEPI